MAYSSASAREQVFTCPACGKPVIANLAIEFELGEVVGAEVEVKGRVTGLEVSHNCIPRTVR